MAQYPAASTTVNVAANKTLITKAASAASSLLAGSLTPTSTTASSSNATYGSWAQVSASTAAEYLVVGVWARCGTALGGSITGPMYVDVGTGGAGSETVMTTVVIGGTANTDGTSTDWHLDGWQPLPIPLRVSSGTRVAARSALTTTGGSTRTVQVHVSVVPYTNVEGN